MNDFIHYHEIFVICPHCNHRHVDMCDYGFDGDRNEEEKEFTCDSCGKEFIAMLHISYEFSTWKKEQPCEKKK